MDLKHVPNYLRTSVQDLTTLDEKIASRKRFISDLNGAKEVEEKKICEKYIKTVTGAREEIDKMEKDRNNLSDFIRVRLFLSYMSTRRIQTRVAWLSHCGASLSKTESGIWVTFAEDGPMARRHFRIDGLCLRYWYNPESPVVGFSVNFDMAMFADPEYRKDYAKMANIPQQVPFDTWLEAAWVIVQLYSYDMEKGEMMKRPEIPLIAYNLIQHELMLEKMLKEAVPK